MTEDTGDFAEETAVHKSSNRASGGQRLNYLRQRFASLNFRPRRCWGQNFLLDTNLARYIARLGAPGAGDIILEVGCGSGLLTRHLAANGARVIAVEIDARLLNMAREEMSGVETASFIQADILAGKHCINPAVIAEVRAALSAAGEGGKLKTISNLPYAVGTPFVANLFASDLPWERGVFLLQDEVAERLTAHPGERMYGPLAIYASLAGKARIARRVPPTVFWPRPAVISAVVTVFFRPRQERMALPWPKIRRILSAVFSRRRKTLRNALSSIFPSPAAALTTMGIDCDLRPADVAPEQFLRLAQNMEEIGMENVASREE